MQRKLANLMFTAVAACGQDITTAGVDAAVSAIVDGSQAAPDAPAQFQCMPRVSSVDSGMHNAGLDCRGSCHDHGFTAAGTLYTSDASTTGIAGATITIFDSAGKRVDMTTQANGNFFTREPLTYPLTAFASACPDVMHMPRLIREDTGAGCNQFGCHAGGMPPGRLHLP